jgi:hypothetical protein
MDEPKMHKWIDVVLKLWTNTWDANNPSAEPPILVLDLYCIHQIGSVVNKIHSMGTGCTY